MLKSTLRLQSLLMCAAIAFVISGCKKETEDGEPSGPGSGLQVPATYQSADYLSNTQVEYSVRSQMSQLKAYMKKGENVANVLLTDSLQHFYSGNGAPSISDITAPDYRNLINGYLFAELASSSGNNYDPADGATATTGGVYGARLLNRRAKETLEEVEKGLFEAAMYNHLAAISEDEMTPAVVDRMVAIYGAHPSFPNTNTSANTPNPDGFMALYAARRDKNDGTGLYTRIRDQFIRLRAAVEGGSQYDADRDAALAAVKLNIEKAVMATVIHYGFAAVNKLSSTSPTPSTIAGGLHDLAEAVGFVHGFRAVPQEHRLITNAEIDQVLGLLLAPSADEGTMYRFVTDGVNTLPNIAVMQNILKGIYGFTTPEMEDFRQNWISVQSR
jgi:hypothetical protein